MDIRFFNYCLSQEFVNAGVTVHCLPQVVFSNTHGLEVADGKYDCAYAAEGTDLYCIVRSAIYRALVEPNPFVEEAK